MPSRTERLQGGVSVDDLLTQGSYLHRMGIVEWCWTDYPEPQPPQWTGWLEACRWVVSDWPPFPKLSSSRERG